MSFFIYIFAKINSMKMPDKCSSINVLYDDGSEESFKPTSKIEEFEDCYEFSEHLNENFDSMVVLMKMDIRKIRFVKG